MARMVFRKAIDLLGDFCRTSTFSSEKRLVELFLKISLTRQEYNQYKSKGSLRRTFGSFDDITYDKLKPGRSLYISFSDVAEQFLNHLEGIGFIFDLTLEKNKVLPEILMEYQGGRTRNFYKNAAFPAVYFNAAHPGPAAQAAIVAEEEQRTAPALTLAAG